MSTSTTEAGEADASTKAAATLKARLALAGHELHELADGSFIVGRWGLTRTLPSLDAVHRFALQVGAIDG